MLTHPWVAARRDAIHMGVQVFALPEDPDPTTRVIEAGLLADRLGFDGFFIGDHPAYQTEPWLHLAALARETRRVTLGSVVNCVIHRHPTMHARLAADLDRLSDGRALLGLGIGWNEPEFSRLGLPFGTVRERQDALDEALTIIRGVWGREPFSFSGRHWSTEGGLIEPGPRQPGGPPILIAGAGARTLQQVARFADVSNWGSGRNVGKVATTSDLVAKFGQLRDACDLVGRDYDSILRSHFTTWLMLAETERAAKAKLDRYYPDGMNQDQQLTRIWGTPAQAIAYFQELAEAGVEYFVVQILDAADHETIRLLATEVMPVISPR